MMSVRKSFFVFVILFTLTIVKSQEPQSKYANELSLPKIIFEAILNPKDGLFLPFTALLTRKLCPIDLNDLKKFQLSQEILEFAITCNETFVPPIIKTFPNKTEFSVLCHEDKVHLFKRCGGVLSIAMKHCLESKNLSSTISHNNWRFTEAYTGYFCNNYERFLSDLVSDDNQMICITSKNKNKIVKCIDEQIMEAEPQFMEDICWNYGIVQHCINESIMGCVYESNVLHFLTTLNGTLNCKHRHYTYTSQSKAVGFSVPSFLKLSLSVVLSFGVINYITDSPRHSMKLL